MTATFSAASTDTGATEAASDFTLGEYQGAHRTSAPVNLSDQLSEEMEILERPVASTRRRRFLGFKRANAS